MRRSLFAAACIGAVLSGCGDLGPLATTADSGVDAGTGTRTPDALTLADTGFEPPDRFEVGDRCLNLRDDDENGLRDCQETGCQSSAVPACCVGVLSQACCGAESSPAAVTACTAAGCLSFEGQPLPLVHGRAFDVAPSACDPAVTRAFGPIGDATNHGRAILPHVYSATTRFITIDATVHADETTDLAAAGFGIFNAQDSGPRLTPVLAVVISASTNELRVLEGDRVVATSDLSDLATDACARTLQLRLVLAPSGTYTLYRVASSGMTQLESDRFDPSPSVRVAMFGQQPNPLGNPDAAWVGGLTVSTRACDALLPARTSTPALSDAAHDISGFSIYRVGDSHHALVASEGQLYWFGVNSSTGAFASGSSTTLFANPIAFPGTVTDIDVFESGSGLKAVLAVTDPATMVSRLVLAEVNDRSSATTLTNPQDLLNPSVETTDAFVTFQSVDSPSVVNDRGVLRVAFRAFEGARSSLRMTTLNTSTFARGEDTTGTALANGMPVTGLLHAPSGTVDAFDRDEVADPELYVQGGVLRILFAGRRGTRWSLGTIVASDNVTSFAPTASEPVGPSGTGFDALGLMDPEFITVMDADRLYYLGSDGVRRSIGLATQPR